MHDCISLPPPLVRSSEAHSRGVGEDLAHMEALLNSHMFQAQGIKLKWIRGRIERWVEWRRGDGGR